MALFQKIKTNDGKVSPGIDVIMENIDRWAQKTEGFVQRKCNKTEPSGQKSKFNPSFFKFTC